ncbi:MAG: S8 family serine peptidase, partial [Methanobacteriota archaeon]
MNTWLRKPIALVLIASMTFSSFAVLTALVTVGDVGEESQIEPGAEDLLIGSEGIDTIQLPDDNIHTYSDHISKIHTDLLSKLTTLGSEPVEVLVFADDISLLHEALNEGSFSADGYLPSEESSPGTTILDIPANIIPKLASLPNVRAILEYQTPEAPNPDDYWRGTPTLSGDTPSPEMWQVTLTQGAVEAWSLGFEGSGINVAVLDTGVDFGHPDLNGTQARVENPASPYFGWPIAFDTRSMRRYLNTGLAFPNANIWFSDTSSIDTDSNSDGFLDTSGYEIGNITSQSGNYHLGVHPDDYLRIRYGHYVPVLVVDTQVAGVYDAVYADLDDDSNFTDEWPAVRGDEVLAHDLGTDGLADRSGGLVYFIADGVTPIPYSDSIAQDMGVPNIIPTNGDLVAFMMNDATEAGGSHGTLCASAVAAQAKVSGGAVKGMAPQAKIISVGNIYQGGNWYDNYFFSVEGYDGIPDTGDEANILSMSFGSSNVINQGWSYDARLVDEITTYHAPNATFMVAAGNGGFGYGTIVSPGSSPGVVTVGASTSIWTSDPSNFTTWGDIISWSDRGPSALGQMDPDILSVGAWGSGDVTLNQVGNANSAWGMWGGTSMATPVAAGIMSLLYESYNDAHGVYPTSSTAREIIMSSADNINYDPLMQGAGISNASRAVRLANQQYGVAVSPSFWTVGDYKGTHYDAFANIAFPGDTHNFTLQVSNADQLNTSQVNVRDEAHVRTKTIQYTIQSDTSLEDGYQSARPDHIIPLIDLKSSLYEVPPDADLVKVSAYLGYFDFDPDWDYGIENRYRISLFDWWDEDGDGIYWNDINGDGTVQQDELDGYPNYSELTRFVDSYQAANRLEARVHNPYDRIHDGLLIGIFHTRTTASLPVTNVNVRVDTYDLADCSWLSVSPTSLSISPGGTSTFQATANLPMDIDVGMYEAFLFLDYDSNETAIPVVVNIATNSSDFAINESSGELYDNGAVFGGYNWGWRYESGDWRHYFIDIPDGSFKQGQQIVANVSWEHVPTDIDVFLMGETPDSFSASHPDRYGPGYLDIKGRSADYWIGGGRFLFNTVTGGAQEIVAADLTPGLWEILLHNVLNAGLDSTENISVDVGTIELNPNPWDVGVVTDFSFLTGGESFLINSTINLPDVDVTAFGVSQPLQFTDQTILQDDPFDTSTSSWSYELDILDGGLLEVSISSAFSIDIDLYVLRDANSNGIPNWNNEVVASSTSPDDTESITIKKPTDGKYWVFVHGWSVGGGSSTFDIDIDAIQGTDLTVSDVPTGPLTAYQPENFNGSYTLPATDGMYHGIVFAGPSAAPEVLSVRFYGEVRDNPPEFSNLTPTPDSIIYDNQPTMGASFQDTGSGMNLSSLVMLVDGFNITNLATITSNSIFWATPFLLTEGLHWVSVYAKDNFGNENITTWSFKVDTIPPYLDVVEPPDGLITNNALILVTGSTEPDASLTVNGVPTPIALNGSFSTFKSLSEGQNIISVEATDLAGNSNGIDRTVILDTIPPPLSVTEPLDGSWFNYPTVVFRGTTEPGATVSVGGQLAVVQSDGSFEVPVALFEGSNPVSVSAEDAAGNMAGTLITVNVDTVAPYLFLDSPEDGTITNVPSTSVSGWTELSASLLVNGLPVTVQPDGSFSTNLALIPGENNIFVNVTDLAGNANGAQRSVHLDMVAPPLQVTNPINGLITRQTSTQVQGSSEPDVTLTINGQLFEVQANGSFDVVIALSEGDNVVDVRACDLAGNCNGVQRNVFVDTTAPDAQAGQDA